MEQTVLNIVRDRQKLQSLLILVMAMNKMVGQMIIIGSEI
jgi:hypothetical protein